MKLASVRPLIKGQNLDPELTTYRLISTLFFLSKITEKAVQTQLQKHVDNQCLQPQQQVLIDNICKGTETTLLNLYDNILKYGKSKMYTSGIPVP